MTAAGLIGLKAATPAPAAAAPAAVGSTLTLYGRRWVGYAHGKRPGELPARGDRLVTSGDLHASPGGDKVGEFHAAVFSLGAPGHIGPSGAASLELHTLELPEGSIIAAGTGTPDPDGADVFAIIGGTGRFTGARGTCVARQRYRELGGDGTAELILNFVTGEV
ncbi:MAG: hypothetical protein AB1679_33745 [Actinomycetota bacterium]